MYRLVIALICLIFLTACSTSTQANEEPEEYMSITISPSQARAWMESQNNVIVLDVRTAEEFAMGHIRGAILLPLDEIATQASYTIPDKETLVLVYCRSGVRSLNAAWLLVDMGYTRVFEFGGIIDWPYGTI